MAENQVFYDYLQCGIFENVKFYDYLQSDIFQNVKFDAKCFSAIILIKHSFIVSDATFRYFLFFTTVYLSLV